MVLFLASWVQAICEVLEHTRTPLKGRRLPIRVRLWSRWVAPGSMDPGPLVKFKAHAQSFEGETTSGFRPPMGRKNGIFVERRQKNTL